MTGGREARRWSWQVAVAVCLLVVPVFLVLGKTAPPPKEPVVEVEFRVEARALDPGVIELRC